MYACMYVCYSFSLRPSLAPRIATVPIFGSSVRKRNYIYRDWVREANGNLLRGGRLLFLLLKSKIIPHFFRIIRETVNALYRQLSC